MDLGEFLLARIGEDEDAALAAVQGEWRWDGDAVYGDVMAIEAWGYDNPTVGMTDGTRDHVLRWQPGRVLTECEAKRRIVEGYQQQFHRLDAMLACGDEVQLTIARVGAMALSAVLFALAAPYASHPDYQPEWAPEVLV
jgi:hypothetical protein